MVTRYHRQCVFAVGGFFVPFANLVASPENSGPALWFVEPVIRWIGVITDERMGFNENTRRSRRPYEPSAGVLPGVHAEVQGPPNSQSSHQNIGEVKLAFSDDEKAVDYHRQLDLAPPTVSVPYKLHVKACSRELISSPVDQVIAIQLMTSAPGKINLESILAAATCYRNDKDVTDAADKLCSQYLTNVGGTKSDVVKKTQVAKNHRLFSHVGFDLGSTKVRDGWLPLKSPSGSTRPCALSLI